MTRIVVSLTDATVEGMLATARSTPEADLYECRLDFLPQVDADALKSIAAALPRKALATYRPLREGGRFDGPEASREAVLAAALAHGFAAVDVEHDAPFGDRLVRRARESGALSILSRHDLVATPTADGLVKFAEETAARGADVAKVATTVTTPRDVLSLVTAALRARELGLGVAFMAVNDATLRLLAPALGLALAYAAPDGGVGAAPGQLPARDVRSAFRALGLGPGAAHRRLVILLGDPVAHSASPAFQNAGFRAADVAATYVPSRVPAERLGEAVRALRVLGALGANVTVPHKVAVLQHLDVLDATAREAGAANTVVNREGTLVGHNTDGVGALAALRESGVDPSRERVLLLGAGGAARGVAHALRTTGATVVAVANRSREAGEGLARKVGATFVPWDARHDAAGGATLVVNATSLGLHPDDPLPLAERALRVDHAVLDVAYARGGTAFVSAARSVRCRAVVPGDAVLLHQGAKAFELWTGRSAPLVAMRAKLTEAMRG